MANSRASRLALRGPVTPVEYTPPEGYGLDLEIYPVSVLRRRAERFDLRGVERIDFHCLLYVTAGRYRHMVDFESLDFAPGSLLILQPGQVHRFGNMTGWKGWLMVFRSEFLQPREAVIPVGELEMFRQVEALPTKLHTTGVVRQAVSESFERMADDSKRPVDARTVNALLRSQLHALLIRLHLVRMRSMPDERFEPMVLQRFRRYRTAVEREYRRWHSVAQYAKHLGCSEKSLSRAALEVADMSAKSFLTDRIVLEAKRLLAHTVSPVANIADQLGFDEATNFVKFFRRETGSTPGAFRAGHTNS